ncbi:MAG: hypothetical protein WAZ94_03720 [Phycisphaerales bacterium]
MTKTTSGHPERRRVSTLLPVRYQISIIYLGDSRIRPDMSSDPAADMMIPPPYRCRYRLLEHVGADGAERSVAPLTPIPNQVREFDTGATNDAAAKFFSAGGTAVNPTRDGVYKIMVTDNHGTRTAENLDLLGNNGDTNSNPAYYKARGWMGDVIPAVPFRIVVRRFIGNDQFDVPTGFKAVVQVKDAKEELDQNDGRRRTFLNDFFKKYNRNDGHDTEGDDNMLARFAQDSELAREANQHGYNATKVLRKLTYASQPLIATSSATLAQQQWSDTSPSQAAGSEARATKFDLELKDETLPNGTTVKTGIADFVFTPWPAGGDNHRFLIGLFKGSDDIRDTREQRRTVQLTDDHDSVIRKPRMYTTPRFVFWRRIEWALCVLANNLDENALDWDAIITMYRKCFIEVSRPAHFTRLARTAWRQMLRDLIPQNGTTTPIFNDDTKWTDAVYTERFFPTDLHPLPELRGPQDANGRDTFGNSMDILDQCMRRAIRQACTGFSLPDPGAGDAQTKQHDGNGAYMFLAHNTRPMTFLGAYTGDRMFWFSRPPDSPSANATSTGAHEFAHLRSIRHSFTRTDSYSFTDNGGTNKSIEVINPRNGNIFHHDHDGHDAFACLQAYTRPLNAEPCGLCALCLRFYDRTVMQQAANYKREIDQRYGTPILAAVTDSGGSATNAGDTLNECTGGTLNLAIGATVDVLALGPEFRFTDRGGTASDGRLNLTWYRPQPITGNGFSHWSKNNNRCGFAVARDRTSGVCVRLTGASAGDCVVSCTFNGTTVRVTIRVA